MKERKQRSTRVGFSRKKVIKGASNDDFYSYYFAFNEI